MEMALNLFRSTHEQAKRGRKMKALIILLAVVVLATVANFVKVNGGNGMESKEAHTCITKVCRIHHVEEKAIFGRVLLGQECYLETHSNIKEVR